MTEKIAPALAGLVVAVLFAVAATADGTTTPKAVAFSAPKEYPRAVFAERVSRGGSRAPWSAPVGETVPPTVFPPAAPPTTTTIKRQPRIVRELPRTAGLEVDGEAIVRAAAVEFGVDPDRMARVARCESGFNPRADNGHCCKGIMQQHRKYWPERVVQFNSRFPDRPVTTDIFDGRSNARVSGWMLSEGRWGEWECR